MTEFLVYANQNLTNYQYDAGDSKQVPGAIADMLRIANRGKGVTPSEPTGEDRVQSDLIRSPLVDALEHSTNILVVSLFLNRERATLTRVDIRSAIKAHKEAMRQPELKGEFADSRIRDGKSTVNFWIDHLVETAVLRRVGYPINFELNHGHDFVNICRQFYPVVDQISNLLTPNPNTGVR